MFEKCNPEEVKQEDRQLLIKKWICIFLLISILLLPFFATHEQPLENKVYYNQGKAYFYRAGILFERTEKGWLAKPSGKRSTHSFVYDPNFEMPGDARQEDAR